MTGKWKFIGVCQSVCKRSLSACMLEVSKDFTLDRVIRTGENSLALGQAGLRQRQRLGKLNACDIWSAWLQSGFLTIADIGEEQNGSRFNRQPIFTFCRSWINMQFGKTNTNSSLTDRT